MGEIPSWLIELAESAENEDKDRDPTSVETPDQRPESGFLEEEVNLMDELRSQVEVEPMPDEEVEEASVDEMKEPKKQVTFAGLVPWQQAVLSVLLFLDIAVIGLLFLAMLGRISIP